ncbi:MAG: response regulator transcription factor [Erysipelotrichales bacterium]
MPKLLVIEDDQAIQTLLEYDLKAKYDVKIAGDGQEGLDLLKTGTFDLAIIDWMLPSLSGYEIIKAIRESNSELKIIMLSALDEEMNIVQGLEAGADDYMTKPFSSRELHARIKALLRKSETYKSEIIIDDIKIDFDKRVALHGDIETNLSKVEFELLVLLVENKGIVLSRETINEKLWGYDNEIDLRAIDMHISSLKKKLDIKDRIKSKRGVGYVFS